MRRTVGTFPMYPQKSEYENYAIHIKRSLIDEFASEMLVEVSPGIVLSKMLAKDCIDFMSELSGIEQKEIDADEIKIFLTEAIINPVVRFIHEQSEKGDAVDSNLAIMVRNMQEVLSTKENREKVAELTAYVVLVLITDDYTPTKPNDIQRGGGLYVFSTPTEFEIICKSLRNGTIRNGEDEL